MKFNNNEKQKLFNVTHKIQSKKKEEKKYLENKEYYPDRF